MKMNNKVYLRMCQSFIKTKNLIGRLNVKNIVITFLLFICFYHSTSALCAQSGNSLRNPYLTEDNQQNFNVYSLQNKEAEISADGKYLIICSTDSGAEIIDTSTNTIILKLSEKISNITFSKDSKSFFYTLEGNSILTNYSLADKSIKFSRKINDLKKILLTDNGDLVYLFCKARFEIWNIRLNKEIRTIPEPEPDSYISEWADNCIITRDDQYIIYTHLNRIYFYDFKKNIWKKRDIENENAELTDIFLINQPGAVLLEFEREVSIYDFLTDKTLKKFKFPEYSSIHFTSDTDSFFAEAQDRLISIDAKSLSKNFEIAVSGSIHSVDIFKPNDLMVFNSYLDGTMNFFKLSSQDKLFKLKGHSQFINKIKFSNNGDQLITISNGNEVIVWRINFLKQLDSVKKKPLGITFSNPAPIINDKYYLINDNKTSIEAKIIGNASVQDITLKSNMNIAKNKTNIDFKNNSISIKDFDLKGTFNNIVFHLWDKYGESYEKKLEIIYLDNEGKWIRSCLRKNPYSYYNTITYFKNFKNCKVDMITYAIAAKMAGYDFFSNAYLELQVVLYPIFTYIERESKFRSKSKEFQAFNAIEFFSKNRVDQVDPCQSFIKNLDLIEQRLDHSFDLSEEEPYLSNTDKSEYPKHYGELKEEYPACFSSPPRKNDKIDKFDNIKGSKYSKKIGYMKPKNSLYSMVNPKEIESWVNKGLLVDGKYLTLDALVNKFDQPFKPEPDQLLGLSLDLEKPYLSYDGGKNYLQIAIQAPKIINSKELPINICFVIDKSSSMSSDNKIGYVKNSIIQILDILNTNDIVSIVTFSTTANVLLSGKSINEKKIIINTINEIETDATTDINAGLTFGIEEVMKYKSSDNQSIVVLLSDGEHNVTNSFDGIYDNAKRASDNEITISTLGYGLEFNEELLQRTASYGKGKYYFVSNPTIINPTFTSIISKARAVVAKAIRLQIVFEDSIQLKKVFGFDWLTENEVESAKKEETQIDKKLAEEFGIETNRKSVDENGINILIPNLMSEHYYLIMMEIKLSKNTKKEDKSLVASVNLKYKDIINKKNGDISKPIYQHYSNQPDIYKKIDLNVVKNKLSLRTGEILQQASYSIKENSIDKAKKLILDQIGLLDEFVKMSNDKDMSQEVSILRKYSAVVESLNNPRDINLEQKKSFVKKTLQMQGFGKFRFENVIDITSGCQTPKE